VDDITPAQVLQRGAHELLGLLWVEGDAETARLSSLGHHLGRCVDASLGDPPAYWALGNTPFERQAAWQARLAVGLAPAQLRAIERALSSGIPLASAQRLAELQPSAPLRLFPRPRGRPRS
jgi:putative transposase